MMDRYIFVIRIGFDLLGRFTWFLVQTLGVWLLTTAASLTRLGANFIGVVGVIGLVSYGLFGNANPDVEWSSPPVTLILIAVGLRVVYEICLRGLSYLLPDDQSLIL